MSGRALLLWALLAPLPAEAGGVPPEAPHPGHETIAEAEINGAAGTLEVSLCVDSMVLERSLRARHAEPPRLEDSAVEPLLANLLRSQFLVRSPRGGPATLRYVGRELEGLDVWLYFELELPKRGNRLQLSNQLLLDVEPGQAHRMHLRALNGERVLRFDWEQPWHDLNGLAWRSAQLRRASAPPPWIRLAFEATIRAAKSYGSKPAPKPSGN